MRKTPRFSRVPLKGYTHASQGEGFLMALTEKQQQRINRYLRDVNEHLDGVDETTRAQAERRVRLRIEQELKRYGNAVVKDDAVESVLATLGTPARQAAIHRPGGATASSWAPVKEDRRWLGVCGAIANELQIDPLIVRVLVLLLGFVTLPFSLWVYLGAYAVMGFALQPPPARERIAPMEILRAVWPPALVTLLIHLGVTYFIDGLDWALNNVAGFSLLVLESRWAWYADGAFGTFFWALLFVIPLAAMSALPVRPDWQPTFKKLAQAAVAVYSVYAAYGLGSLLTGVGIHFATRYDGPTLNEIARNLTLPF